MVCSPSKICLLAQSLSRVWLCTTPWSIHGILQARILEWIAIPFSRGSFQPRNQSRISCIAGKLFTSEPPGKPKHEVFQAGQNTGVGSLSLLQEMFPDQGLNPGLPHCRWILYQLSHQGSPRILEWEASPFSSRSSPPRNQTGISCIAGGFFTSWATRGSRFLLILCLLLLLLSRFSPVRLCATL